MGHHYQRQKERFYPEPLIWIAMELKYMNDRLDRFSDEVAELDAAVGVVLGYIEELKKARDEENWDGVDELIDKLDGESKRLEAAVPQPAPAPEPVPEPTPEPEVPSEEPPVEDVPVE